MPVAVVTGAGSGIGKATAAHLIKAGFKVHPACPTLPGRLAMRLPLICGL